tara:strand:- start:597 stop:752 length:156 start_codon:yes stop_codon:yes gene_type:complete
MFDAYWAKIGDHLFALLVFGRKEKLFAASPQMIGHLNYVRDFLTYFLQSWL